MAIVRALKASVGVVGSGVDSCAVVTTTAVVAGAVGSTGGAEVVAAAVDTKVASEEDPRPDISDTRLLEPRDRRA
jgi:hypothetical protein